MGSDGSAAGGRGSDQSEWPRSAENEPAASGEVFAGYRNRTPGLSRRLKGHILTFFYPDITDIAPLESHRVRKVQQT